MQDVLQVLDWVARGIWDSSNFSKFSNFSNFSNFESIFNFVNFANFELRFRRVLETLFHAQAGHLAQGEEIHTISEFFHLVARRGMKYEKEKKEREREG